MTAGQARLPDHERDGRACRIQGVSGQDRYANYFGYDCEHGPCDAHPLPELEGAIDRAQNSQETHWAARLQELLRGMNQAVKRAKADGKTAFHALRQLFSPRIDESVFNLIYL